MNKYDSKIKLIEEPVEEWNKLNLLKLFYEEKDRWSFTFEHYVQLSRLRAHMTSLTEAKNNTNKIVIMERSLWSSHNVFARNTREENGISNVEYDILNSYFKTFSEKLIKDSNCDLLPFKIIYIQTDPSVCYERLRIRNRDAENTVSLEYLTKIHVNYEQWIANVANENPSLVSIIDGNVHKANVFRQIEKITLADDHDDHDEKFHDNVGLSLKNF